ncbi:RNase3 domain-containing protein [Oopsacas minuta]|uniref:RNase3 domain-containing protein n=1 Tax=Oopsacas minuta TaxID=111878 RepID=A0AAV7JLU2_9METZ|nr:RNase3 domain-containing protein [Oopsacas minuta]
MAAQHPHHYKKNQYKNRHHYRRYNNNNYDQHRDDVVVPEKKPRPYQTELLQSALNGNRIIALGTGAGKTHIACMLIRKMVEGGSLLPGQRIMFLAPTGIFLFTSINVYSLIQRLYDFLENYCSFSININLANVTGQLFTYPS